MNESQDCILTRTLAARLDLKKTDGYFEHIEQCFSCRQHYLRIQKDLKEVDLKIPIVPLSLEEREEIMTYSLGILEKFDNQSSFKERIWSLWDRWVQR